MADSVRFTGAGARTGQYQRSLRGVLNARAYVPECAHQAMLSLPNTQHEALRGYQASKKRYFWEFKVHLLVTREGEPVEFLICGSSLYHLEGLWRLPVNLLEGSTIYGDKAYFDATEELSCVKRGAKMPTCLCYRRCLPYATPRASRSIMLSA
ncbi:MAG: hypothetical protein EOO38_15780 [Cytophagaceae bacterium]|nr:MAG: hypothetical protein EOO38_15780 [Cytophagaceae bacterium]